MNYRNHIKKYICIYINKMYTILSVLLNIKFLIAKYNFHSL